jgi:hypothetical protein
MTLFENDSDRDMIDGILQPNGHFRVPMFLRDGAPNPSLTPVQRAIAVTRQHDAATFDAATFDASLHKPGHRYATGTGTGINDATHRPGYRYGVTNDASEKAYADRDRAMSDSWRGNAGAGTFNNAPPAGSDPEGTSQEGDNNRRDGQQAMDAAYAEYDLRMENSWRHQS